MNGGSKKALVETSRFSGLYERLEVHEEWQKNWAARFAWWPGLCEVGKRFQAKPNSFHPAGVAGSDSQNFWTLGEQYHLLAWSMYTQAYSEFHKSPYRDNISSDEDRAHQQELMTRIVDNGPGLAVWLPLAHLACELALKALDLHMNAAAGKTPSFRKTHNLQMLFDDLPAEVRKSIRDGFKQWPHRGAAELKDIIHDSGNRFERHRYGTVFESSTSHDGKKKRLAPQLCVLDLSRFFYESESTLFGADGAGTAHPGGR